MKEKYYSLPETEISYTFYDETGNMADRLTDRWLLEVAEANPGMLLMLKERNERPFRQLLPWSGEFIGKHLTGAAEMYMLTGNKKLKEHAGYLVDQLVKIQAPDGYIGPWAKEYQLTGISPNSRYEFDAGKEEGAVIPNWDLWNLYHMMYGLILWHRKTKEQKPLDVAVKLAELLYRSFSEKKRPFSSVGTPETNLAPVHSLALLYEVTGKERYLRMAESIVEEFSLPGGPDYRNLALSGTAFYRMPIPRWEGLHAIMGLSVLYEITGKEDYRKSFLALWESMKETDRHNTGGFTSGEAACGNPYDERAIETCCTVAWMALTVQKLRMTKDPLAADELELSYYNGGLGAISPSGRYCTYNTPMDGYRIPGFREIGFQVRPGTPDLNCCSVNAPRILGLLSQWGCVRDGGGIWINYYGNCEMTVPMQEGFVMIGQESLYPADGKVSLKVSTDRVQKFALYLRIPHWARGTEITVDGEKILPEAGAYARIERCWKKETTLEMNLGLSVRSLPGEREKAGQLSLYYGPVLLAYDPAFERGGEERLVFGRRVTGMKRTADAAAGKYGRALLMAEVVNAKGDSVTLCDFRSAGYSGKRYRTWFDAK